MITRIEAPLPPLLPKARRRPRPLPHPFWREWREQDHLARHFRHARTSAGHGVVPGTKEIGAFVSRWHADCPPHNEPELEGRIMSDNPHLARILRCPANYRQVLAAARHWPGGIPKQPRPKEALEHLRKRHGDCGFNVNFGKLAATMSVNKCQDAASNQLRDALYAWFPEQQ